jgi:hypothetical protein
MVTEGVPWFGRRAKDLGPWAARLAVTEARGLAQRPVLPTRLPVVRRGALAGVAVAGPLGEGDLDGGTLDEGGLGEGALGEAVAS